MDEPRTPPGKTRLVLFLAAILAFTVLIAFLADRFPAPSRAERDRPV